MNYVTFNHGVAGSSPAALTKQNQRSWINFVLFEKWCAPAPSSRTAKPNSLAAFTDKYAKPLTGDWIENACDKPRFPAALGAARVG